MESTPAPARPPNPALPYREDCWSEGETSTLIDAWGDRYIELNRGNLRQKQWQEVADAVNSRPCGARRPARTDVQCKNRIDTLKKKYKQEKAKLADGAPSSGWPFFPRLDALIGSNVSQIKKPPPAAAPAATPAPRSPPLALPLPSHRKGFPLPAAAAAAAATVRPAEKRSIAAVDDSFYRRKFSAAAAAAAAAAAEESDSSSRSSRSLPRARSPPRARSVVRSGVRRRRREREGEGMGEEDGIRQLSRAIVRFAEIYEKVEVEKQRQMMELEKQRMEFAKGLEFQRMQIFVDSQVQLEKIKRARRAAAADDAGENGFPAAVSYLMQPLVFDV